MRRRCGVLLLVLSVLAGPLDAKILYVDDDAPGDLLPGDPRVSDPNEDGSADHPFDSIQEAIDAASSLPVYSSVSVDRLADTIVVAPGHYLSLNPWEYEEINFKDKAIQLISSAPTDFSVIEQTVLGGVVIFKGLEGPTCLLQGFKIQNYDCGGILGNHTQASIRYCIISGNGPCGATVLKDVEGEVRNCLIVDNTTFHDCGVLPVVSGCPTFINCTIANNLSGVQFTTAGLPGHPGANVFHNCIIYGNEGPQLLSPTDTSFGWPLLMDYCLIEGVSTATRPPSMGSESTVWTADPCFVRWGHWEDVPVGPVGRTKGPAPTTKVLIEGDYHLQSQGWRWSEQSIHGSNWYFDTSTSPAIDAGDPMDSLGEELERIPDDPEGRWGFNHAIELGAYSGTAQASLTPTQGEPPGVGAVDLHDFWPLGLTNLWLVHDSEGTARTISGMGGGGNSQGQVLYYLATSNAPGWVPRVSCYYVESVLYITQDSISLFQLADPPEHVQAQYPQYLVPGTTIQAPYDPFTLAPVEYRSVLVVRSTLTEVLAGTSVDPNQFLAGTWPDVIAFKEIKADGAAGDPVAIFARGFGPLLIAGLPIEGARIDGKIYGTYVTPPGRRD